MTSIGSQALIFDNGSGTSKCGFSGDDSPREVFPSVVCRPKSPGLIVGMDTKDCYVGVEAWNKRGFYKLKYPIEDGMVTNWNDMEKIWHHSYYNELRVNPEEHPVLITQSPFNSKNNQEKATKILFETFEVPSMYLAVDSVLSLFAYGKNKGIVLDSGYGRTSVVPVYEGSSIPHAVSSLIISGKDISNFLGKILCERGYEMTTQYEREIVNDMKEKICFISSEYQNELERAEKTGDCECEYELPDGSKMTIGSERFRAPEILFKPVFDGYSEVDGVHETIFNSIEKCDVDMKKDLYENIILSGGSTLFKGFEERLSKEIEKLVSKFSNSKKNGKFVVNSTLERKFSSWKGGSILTCLDSFKELWITKKEYDESGVVIALRKCFT